jgi:hypothetical protein
VDWGLAAERAREWLFLLDLHTKKSPLETTFGPFAFFHEKKADPMVVSI